MAEIINLRQARKRLGRIEKEKAAEAGRAASSIPGRLRKAARQDAERDKARLDAHRLASADAAGDDDTP